MCKLSADINMKRSECARWATECGTRRARGICVSGVKRASQELYALKYCSTVSNEIRFKLTVLLYFCSHYFFTSHLQVHLLISLGQILVGISKLEINRILGYQTICFGFNNDNVQTLSAHRTTHIHCFVEFLKYLCYYSILQSHSAIQSQSYQSLYCRYQRSDRMLLLS